MEEKSSAVEIIFTRNFTFAYLLQRLNLGLYGDKTYGGRNKPSILNLRSISPQSDLNFAQEETLRCITERFEKIPNSYFLRVASFDSYFLSIQKQRFKNREKVKKGTPGPKN